jgi:DNA-binding transcriptional LysR family regulator
MVGSTSSHVLASSREIRKIQKVETRDNIYVSPTVRTLLRDHLDKLHAFRAVVLAGSLRKAAQQLRISQPSLSRSVRILEDATGSTLLRRSTKGITLTRSGEMLLAFSTTVEKELAALEGRLRFPEETASGAISIGTYESLAVRLWPKFIRRFARKYPFVAVSLTTDSYRALSRRLFDGELQLMVTTRVERHPELRFDVLYKDSFGLFRASRAPASRRTRDDVRKLPIVTVPLADSYGLRIDEVRWQLGSRATATYQLDTFEAARELAIEGIGVAILPRALAREAVARGRLREIRAEGIARELAPHEVGVTARAKDLAEPLVALLRAELLKDFAR